MTRELFARSNIGVPAPAAPDPRLLAALLAGAAGDQQSPEPKGPSLNEVGLVLVYAYRLCSLLDHQTLDL